MPIVKPPLKRCIVFVDGANLYKTLKELSLWCDYNLLIKASLEQLDFDIELIRIYFYTAIPDQNREPENYRKTLSFLGKLQKWNNWELRLGRIVYRNGVPTTKGVDAKLVSDAIFFAIQDMYDLALFTTGDADIAYCFEAIKLLKKQIAILQLPKNFSNELTNKADYKIDFPEKICSKRKKV